MSLEVFFPSFGILFIQHAALVWLGLFFLFKRSDPVLRPLRGMLVGSIAVSLALWSEPRYLVPFYLPLFLLSIDFILPRLPWVCLGVANTPARPREGNDLRRPLSAPEL